MRTCNHTEGFCVAGERFCTPSFCGREAAEEFLAYAKLTDPTSHIVTAEEGLRIRKTKEKTP